jgi:hypothetical protein
MSQLGDNIRIFARKVYDMHEVTSKYVELYRGLFSCFGLSERLSARRFIAILRDPV